MTTLLVYKEKLKQMYAKYDAYIIPVIKFLFAFVSLMLLNANVGYGSKLKNPIIVLILALLCSFLPPNMIVIIGGVFLLGHFYALSLELAVVAVAVLLLMYLLYYRFSPKDTYVVLLTPLLFGMKIPYLIPLAMGLIGTPVSAVSVGLGTVVYYMIKYVKANSTMLGNTDTEDVLQKIRAIIDAIFNNKEMLLTIVAFSVTLVVVYLIRRLSIDYAWNIAIIAGALTNVVIMIAGDFMLNVSANLLMVFIGTVISILLTVILQFFVFSVDYSRTEHVQFEDDEYYYYVKAVPKMTVSAPNKRVQRISPQKKQVRRVRDRKSVV